MFTQKCFIRKNSKELRDKLHRLGDRPGEILWDGTNGVLLCVGPSSYRNYDDEFGNADSLIKDGYIDCGENEDLFLAIASLRDDNNTNQWFIWDDDDDEGEKWKLYDDNENWSWWEFECHKATVDELIEHFK
jgi:hypothetical protein